MSNNESSGYYKESGFCSAEVANEALATLTNTIEWKMFGPSPRSRRVARCEYRALTGQPDTDRIISGFCEKLINKYNVTIRGIFFNLYENGGDYCPYHADTYGTDVYTLSLGSTRDILIKENGIGTRADKITLESGDLYYMPNALQSTHKHSIPKRKSVGNSRISIVFFTTPTLKTTIHECEECSLPGIIKLDDGGVACSHVHYFDCRECNKKLMLANREPDGRCYACNGGE